MRDALTADQVDWLNAGCEREIRNILALDKQRRGNRGSHRYSFGSASKTGQLLHHAEWAMLVDLPTVTPIITAIWGAPTYLCNGGAGTSASLVRQNTSGCILIWPIGSCEETTCLVLSTTIVAR